MAPINRKDLGQILIKETTADTNDVFNVLISRGAKGGLDVAEQLINVLNISIPFHHLPRSLNSLGLPPCSITLSFPLSIQTPFQSHPSQSASLPPPCKVNVKVFKVVLLCVSTSCGHCVLNLRKIKDAAVQTTTGFWHHMKINCLSDRVDEMQTFNYTMLIFE